MNNKKELKNYTVKFLKEFRPRIRPDVGVNISVYPVEGSGGVVELKLVRGMPFGHKKIEYKTASKSVNEILGHIPQKIVEGDLNNIKFQGTNISLEENRILLIKGDDECWKEENAVSDLTRVFNAFRSK